MTDPKTGEQLVMPSDSGDVEVFFPEDDEWIPVFYWYERNSTASCNARFQPGDTSHPVWNAAVALASALGAVIQGDEGEVYDLQTGEIVDS